MNRKIALRLTTVIAGLIIATMASADSPLWGDLKPGPYAVGFQVMETYDYSRPYIRKYDYEGNLHSGNRARPIQINIWYPAEKGGSTPAKLVDYVHLTVKERSFGPITKEEKEEAVQGFLQSRWLQGAPEERLRELLQINTAAVRDAKVAQGSFPLVLYVHSVGISSASSGFILSEYLASRGYIVASVPSTGASTPRLDGRESHVQFDDLQFTIQKLHDFPGIDHDKLALIGYGFGGLSTSLLAMHNSDVDALISLDSSLASIFGYSLIFQNNLYKPLQLTVPVIHITSLRDSPITEKAFFNATKYADVLQLELKGMSPQYFSSFAMIASMSVKPEDPEKVNPADWKAGYEAACRYAVNFLDAHVKNDASAAAFLKNSPEQNGVPATYAQLDRKEGLKPVPPSEQQFVQILKDQGVEKAAALMREVVQDNPEYQIFDEGTLMELANIYIQEKNTKLAVDVMKLTLEAYPENAEVLEAMGRAYMENGNKQMAIEHLTRALEINPDSSSAAEMLQKLQQS